MKQVSHLGASTFISREIKVGDGEMLFSRITIFVKLAIENYKFIKKKYFSRLDM